MIRRAILQPGSSCAPEYATPRSLQRVTGNAAERQTVQVYIVKGSIQQEAIYAGHALIRARPSVPLAESELPRAPAPRTTRRLT